jgi:RNA polymerase sigma factor (TIGR02999 family)
MAIRLRMHYTLRGAEMGDVTRILSDIESGDCGAAEQLLPLIYDELRKLAAAKMAGESPDHTLQATALVHDAYLRLVDVEQAQQWDSRGHFFAAAAEAMRRILVDVARRKQRPKHGGDLQRVNLTASLAVSDQPPVDILDLDEALVRLTKKDHVAAQLVTLRFFGGLTMKESSEFMGLSLRSTERLWAYAQAWLHQAIECEPH